MDKRNSDYALSGDFGDQLTFDTLGPVAGERYRRTGGGAIVTVVRVWSKRRPYVTIRTGGEERVMTGADFAALYEPL